MLSNNHSKREYHIMWMRAFSLSTCLLLIFYFVGCVTTPSSKENKLKIPKHYEMWTAKKYEESVGPIHISDKFVIGNGNRVYIITKFLDLVPNSKYRFKFEWYKPNGKMFGVKKVTQKVSEANWFTGNYLKLDNKYKELYEPGLWSVKVYANENFIDEKKFFIAFEISELNKIVELEEKRDIKSIEKQQIAQTVSDYWAVVIGISEYKYSGSNGLENLIFADDDAKVFARLLYDLGWSNSHIKLLVNEKATKRNITIALESWLTKAGPNDQIILFWAGHGFPNPDDPEKVYFACYDTNISIPATGYRMDRVRAALEEIKSKNVIILADTCHAGKLITRGERNISIVPQIERMSREQKIPKGWIFMVGADTDRQAIEHTSWANGAFTYSLVKGLSGEADGFKSAGVKDGIVTMGELKDYMNISMPEETQKILGVAKRPIITTSTGDPDVWNLSLQVK